ncbi:hypothetical protein [Vibrio cionasavignyae]|uniref:cyanobactin maturation protease PatG family protein n=1 Tax=Vibrio cionasavignyae TaxID=2910252 RepID=UPI003D0B5EAF
MNQQSTNHDLPSNNKVDALLTTPPTHTQETNAEHGAVTQCEKTSSATPTLSDAAPVQCAEEIVETIHTPAAVAMEHAIPAPSYVYVAGKLRVHFPTRGLEKEYEAATQTLGLNPRNYNLVFTHKDNNGNLTYRYIAEQVSWILSVEGQDAYVLLPNSSDELDEFIDALTFDSASNLADETYSVAIGVKGPIAPDKMSDDKPLPMVRCHHLFHFTTEQLQKELSGENTTTIAISNVLDALTKKPNIGVSEFDRAKNFIAYRYPTIYAASHEGNHFASHAPNHSTANDAQYLESLEVQYSNVAPGRTIVDIILTYQKNVSGRQLSYFASVDVTDQFPFLHSNLTDYIPTNQ